MFYLIAALLCSNYYLRAQSVQVVLLQPSDAKRAAELYDRMLQSQKDWNLFQNQIRASVSLSIMDARQEACSNHQRSWTKLNSARLSIAALGVREFHKLYDEAKPAYEYWFGEAIQKSMPTNLHGIVQFHHCHSTGASRLERLAGRPPQSIARCRTGARRYRSPRQVSRIGCLRINTTAIELQDLFSEVDRKLETP